MKHHKYDKLLHNIPRINSDNGPNTQTRQRGFRGGAARRQPNPITPPNSGYVLLTWTSYNKQQSQVIEQILFKGLEVKSPKEAFEAHLGPSYWEPCVECLVCLMGSAGSKTRQMRRMMRRGQVRRRMRRRRVRKRDSILHKPSYQTNLRSHISL